MTETERIVASLEGEELILYRLQGGAVPRYMEQRSVKTVPIRPENAKRYPRDWKQVRQRILARAGEQRDLSGLVIRQACCERCGVENHAIGVRNRRGEFLPLDDGQSEAASLDGEHVIRIVLTIAHVNDPRPENCADDNLAALCQKCHLNHDQKHHAKMRVQNQLEREHRAGQMLISEAA